MTTKSKLQEIFEAAEFNVRSYSGRGMFRRECLAITTDLDLGQVFAAVLEGVQGNDDTMEIQEAFQNMRTDQMGLGSVIYFPDVQFGTEDAMFEDEDDSDSDEESEDDAAE